MDRSHINHLVKKSTKMIVQSGPFAGIRLVDSHSWGDGDISAKLLGVYEQELHQSIEKLHKNDYKEILDIGCAEGFYAVGLAMIFKTNKIHAFDSNPKALLITAEAASLNGVADRVLLNGFCSSETIADIISGSGRSLIFSDCEGYEAELLCNDLARSALATSDLIVECHDYRDKRITPSLFASYFESHEISIIEAGGRNPNVFPFLSKLTDPERWQAINENRMCKMHWLVMEARSRSR